MTVVAIAAGRWNGQVRYHLPRSRKINGIYTCQTLPMHIIIGSAEELGHDSEVRGVMLTSEMWEIYPRKTNLHFQFIGSLSTPPSSSSATFTFQQPQRYLQPNHSYELHRLLHTKTNSVRQWEFHATVPPILFDSPFFAWKIRFIDGLAIKTLLSCCRNSVISASALES
jgi:hypothetical protein